MHLWWTFCCPPFYNFELLNRAKEFFYFEYQSIETRFINEVKCVFSEILVAKWKDYQHYHTLSSDVFSITGWGLILISVRIQISSQYEYVCKTQIYRGNLADYAKEILKSHEVPWSTYGMIWIRPQV